MTNPMAVNLARRARENAENNFRIQSDTYFRRKREGKHYQSPYRDMHKDIFMQSMLLLWIIMDTAGTSFLITYYLTSSGTKHRWALAIVPAVVGIFTTIVGGFIIYDNQRTQKTDPKYLRV